MLFSNKDRIIFAGDSITDVDRNRPVGEGLFSGTGKGYVMALFARNLRESMVAKEFLLQCEFDYTHLPQ